MPALNLIGRCALRGGGLTVLTAACLQSASAGVWDNEGLIATSVRWSDNPALLSDIQETESTLALVASAQGEFSFIDPNREITIVPKIVQTYYPDRDFSDLDQTDYFLRVSTNTRDKLINWGGSVSYDDQGILTAEDANLEDPDDSGDANFLSADDRRERIAITPTFSWAPTTKDLVSVSAGFSRVDFDQEFTGRADFDTYTTAVNYQRSVTERQGLGLSYSTFSSDAESSFFTLVCSDGGFVFLGCPDDTRDITLQTVNNDSDGRNLEINYTYQISELIAGNLSFGRQETEIETRSSIPGDSFSSASSFRSNTYRAGLSKDGPRFDWSFSLSRSVQPTSLGSPADTIRFSGNMSYRLTELVSVSLQGSGFTQDVRSALTSRENEFVRVDATLSWRFTRRLSVNSTYTFRRQNPNVRQLAQDPADDNDTPVDPINEALNLTRTSNSVTVFLRYNFE